MRQLVLDGQRFGRLVALARDPARKRVFYICKCDCGNSAVVQSTRLKSGHTRSCGCLRRDHRGGKHRPTYSSWHTMLRRCYDTQSNRYADYGGRGISVCDEWIGDYDKFVSDMGERPTGTTLDRIDNDGNYEPNNCRWASNHKQARNKRSSVFITHKGKTMCMVDWAQHLGMPRSTLQQRIYRGWSIEKALTTPTQRKRKSI